MKAQFFKKPLNLNLSVKGESWQQGALVTGELKITNTSNETIDFNNLGCHLCYCNSKKLKVNNPDAVTILESFQVPAGSDQLDFKFILDQNCPITDNIGSLQILCGDIRTPLDCGMLRLEVRPANVIQNFIEVFELFYRFKFKPYKNKKDLIEVQAQPPASREWANLQKMSILLKMNNETLDIFFKFVIKKISYDTSTSQTIDEKKEIKISIPKKDYSIYGSCNQDGIRKHISTVLDQVKLKTQ